MKPGLRCAHLKEQFVPKVFKALLARSVEVQLAPQALPYPSLSHLTHLTPPHPTPPHPTPPHPSLDAVNSLLSVKPQTQCHVLRSPPPPNPLPYSSPATTPVQSYPPAIVCVAVQSRQCLAPQLPLHQVCQVMSMQMQGAKLSSGQGKGGEGAGGGEAGGGPAGGAGRRFREVQLQEPIR